MGNRFSWIRIPVTYGNVAPLTNFSGRNAQDDARRTNTIVDDARPTNDVRYDGTISGLQIFFIMVAISSTMTFAVYASMRYDTYVDLVTLIVYMLIGLAIMVKFSIRPQTVLVPITERTGDKEPRRDNLTLFGITVFFVLSCATDLLHIITAIGCDKMWKECELYPFYVIEIVYHIQRIAYLGAQTLFCIAFNRSRFLPVPSIRFGLMFLLGVNCSLMFNALVHGSTHGFIAASYTIVDSFVESAVNGSGGSHLQCVLRNCSMYTWLDDAVSPMFHPFTIQFTLLVGECLGHWYFCSATSDAILDKECQAETNVDRCIAYGNPTPPEQNTELQNPNHDGNSIHEVIDSDDDPGSIPFSDSEEEEERNELIFTLSNGEGDDAQVHGTTRTKLMSVVSCVICLVIVLPLCFICFYQKHGPSGKADEFLKIKICYVFALWSAMSVAILVGYYVSSKLKRSNEKFSVLEYTLMGASCGPVVSNILALIVVRELRLRLGEVMFRETFLLSSGIFAASEFMNVVEVALQATFSLYATRIRPGERNTSPRLAIFQFAILFLAFSNLSVWLIECVSSDSVPLQIFQLRGHFSKRGWDLIDNVALFIPISMFFRFVSCLQLCKAYGRLAQWRCCCT